LQHSCNAKASSKDGAFDLVFDASSVIIGSCNDLVNLSAQVDIAVEKTGLAVWKQKS